MTPGQHYARADQLLEDLQLEIAVKAATYDDIDVISRIAHAHALLASCPTEYANGPLETDGDS